jgi:phosphohistidine swiveling domain-containing protein
MAAAGMPVPPGFALLADAFYAWVAVAELRGPLEELQRAIAEGAPASQVDARAEALVAAGRAAELPGPVEAALRDGLVSAGEAGLFAVRSSGELEDGEAASFAGMYDTLLDVEPAGVPAAVRECWLSLFTPRSLRYLADRSLDPARLGMAVVVQAMVPADFSGVCFTVDPLRGDEEVALVELVPGRGDALVEGRRAPSRLRLHRDGEGSEHDFQPDVPPEARTSLTRRIREGLLPLADSLCQEVGLPLDIEFVVRGEEVFLVQARPITRVGFGPEVGEWTNADFNEGGVSSGPCCQFMWSLYDFIWRNTLPEYLWRIGILEERRRPVRWARVFFGVPYWNVGEIKRCLRKVPGFDEQNFDEDLGIEKDYPGGPWKTPTTLRTVLRALPILVFMYREFGRQARESRALLSDFPRVIGKYADIHLEETSDEVFFEMYRQLVLEDYAHVEGTYFMTIFNSSNAKLEFKGQLDSLNAGRSDPVSYLDLMSGMRGLKTLASVHELHGLAGEVVRQPAWRRALEEGTPEDAARRLAAREGPAALWDAVEEYLYDFAHHSRKELDPRVPRWHEEPAFVLELLRDAVRAYDPARDPARLEDQQHARYQAARARAEQAYGWNRLSWWFFDLALRRTRNYCWLREEVRDRSTRLYAQIRRYALDAGRRLAARGVLADADDVFYLPFLDQLRGARGDRTAAEVRAQAEENRTYLARFARFRPPGDIGAGLRARRQARPGAVELSGVGGAPGVARGRARVLRSLDEAHRVERGDVLVAEFTDPGWTPLLERVSAVVTEVGGVLSHAAVIAREYGVPAVLSVRGATQVVRDGAEVEVDGDAGEVRVL